MKLNLACGNDPREGFVSVDLVPLPHVDQVVDLLTFPWPWADGSVDEVFCSHFFEHVPGKLRPAWMSELWRVLADGGTATIQTPLGFQRQVQDFTHEWPPIVPESYLYFDRRWLAANGLTHYAELHGIRCNFAVGDQLVGFTPEFAGEALPDQEYAAKHLMRSTTDLVVVLAKQPMECAP